MKEYDIYIPLQFNDGRAIDPRLFRELQDGLLNQFGGVTYFPQANSGLWKLGAVTYRDEIVIYRVLSDQPRIARRFLRELKRQLMDELAQEEILIVERDVNAL